MEPSIETEALEDREKLIQYFLRESLPSEEMQEIICTYGERLENLTLQQLCQIAAVCWVAIVEKTDFSTSADMIGYETDLPSDFCALANELCRRELVEITRAISAIFAP